MLEFYQAYATYEDLMDLTEKLFASGARDRGGEALDVPGAASRPRAAVTRTRCTTRS